MLHVDTGPHSHESIQSLKLYALEYEIFKGVNATGIFLLRKDYLDYYRKGTFLCITIFSLNRLLCPKTLKITRLVVGFFKPGQVG
jgi:hypothetical protein